MFIFIRHKGGKRQKNVGHRWSSVTDMSFAQQFALKNQICLIFK